MNRHDADSSIDHHTAARRRLLWPTRKFLRSLDNWRRGFAFGYVRRCRVCGHTAYYPGHCDG